MRLLCLALALIGAPLASAPLGDPKIGKPAPALDEAHALSKYQGKPLVLEWVSSGCPFVKRHYGSGNMQALQKKYAALGVAWISVCSSGEGKEGHWSGMEEAQAWLKEQGAAPTELILDPSGEIGRRYGAKTTPHMFVIDAKGKLAYKGALDSHPAADAEDKETGKNYVSLALDALLAGKKVSKSQTKPYGCGVKYAEHKHGEGAWVCNIWYEGDKAHRCTYKGDKPGKCAWCGEMMVKAGSKEDKQRLAKGK